MTCLFRQDSRPQNFCAFPGLLVSAHSDLSLLDRLGILQGSTDLSRARLIVADLDPSTRHATLEAICTVIHEHCHYAQLAGDMLAFTISLTSAYALTRLLVALRLKEVAYRQHPVPWLNSSDSHTLPPAIAPPVEFYGEVWQFTKLMVYSLDTAAKPTMATARDVYRAIGREVTTANPFAPLYPDRRVTAQSLHESLAYVNELTALNLCDSTDEDLARVLQPYGVTSWRDCDGSGRTDLHPAFGPLHILVTILGYDPLREYLTRARFVLAWSLHVPWKPALYDSQASEARLEALLPWQRFHTLVEALQCFPLSSTYETSIDPTMIAALWGVDTFTLAGLLGWTPPLRQLQADYEQAHGLIQWYLQTSARSDDLKAQVYLRPTGAVQYLTTQLKGYTEVCMSSPLWRYLNKAQQPMTLMMLAHVGPPWTGFWTAAMRSKRLPPEHADELFNEVLSLLLVHSLATDPGSLRILYRLTERFLAQSLPPDGFVEMVRECFNIDLSSLRFSDQWSQCSDTRVVSIIR